MNGVLLWATDKDMLKTFRTHLWQIFLLPRSRYACSFYISFLSKLSFYASTNDSKVFIYWCLLAFIKKLFPTVCIVTWLYTTIFSCIWTYPEVHHLFTFINYIWVFLLLNIIIICDWVVFCLIMSSITCD
jgi:hypothetical protein